MARFLRDVRDGNLAAVQRALANNPSAIRAKEPGTERTALHIAAHNRQCDIIQELLGANAPFDVKDSQGCVPLHVAVQTGDAQTVAELLGRGAKVAVKYKNNLGYTPLHLAAKLGHIRVVRELLLSGARADLKDQRGKTPADLVPRVGNNDELVDLLRSAAAEKANSGASAVFSSPPAPRTPATPRTLTPTSRMAATPATARSTIGTGRAASVASPTSPTRARAPAAARSTAASATRSGAASVASPRNIGYHSNLQTEVMADQVEQAREAAEATRAAQMMSDQAIRSINIKLEDLGISVEAQRREVGAASQLAKQALERQANAVQDIQMSLVKRQEQTLGDIRLQLSSAEGQLSAQSGAQADLQIKMSELLHRVELVERSGKGGANGAIADSHELLRKMDLLERKLAASERARIQDRQRDQQERERLGRDRDLTASPSVDELGLDPMDPNTPRSPLGNGVLGGLEGAGARQLRKQGETIATLQRQFAALEARFVDYQEAQAAMAQAEMETPDFMVALRAQLESVASESGSGKSGSNSQSTGADSSVLRSSEGMGGEASGSGKGHGAAMSAIVAALEGLTKEVGKVRVRVAQLVDRHHSTDGRLGYLEEQVGKIRSKMKSIRQWFTLTDSQEAAIGGGGGSAVKGHQRNASRSRSGVLTEATAQAMPERQGMRSGPSSLRSQRSIGSVTNISSPHFV